MAALTLTISMMNYAHDGFLAEFDQQWPAGSPAARSYRARLLHGSDDAPAAAMLGGFSLAQTLCAMATLD